MRAFLGFARERLTAEMGAGA
ncbi:hypothetical protein CO2235_MP40157 [Cupriavidus oxalaticus]|uniref:Uncharacterized protein n=1 Tax=Cupriavidus oxalaticus TaxID=96344 RepID=A0A375GFP6_9BURK|nr:hypothetical protein CO2235_MP40157 [Cupriavidus oxalaticus]